MEMLGSGNGFLAVIGNAWPDLFDHKSGNPEQKKGPKLGKKELEKASKIPMQR